MNPIEKYFTAEKYESVLFVLLGVTAIAFAIYFLLKVKQPFYIGMSFPLIAVALIQIIVGSTVYIRSPKDILRVNEIVQTNRAKIQSEEIARMDVVMKNFNIYRWVEIALLIIGLLLFFFSQSITIWKGVGVGLTIQAGFMLLLDFFAESRGKSFLEYLHTLY